MNKDLQENDEKILLMLFYANAMNLLDDILKYDWGTRNNPYIGSSCFSSMLSSRVELSYFWCAIIGKIYSTSVIDSISSRLMWRQSITQTSPEPILTEPGTKGCESIKQKPLRRGAQVALWLEEAQGTMMETKKANRIAAWFSATTYSSRVCESDTCGCGFSRTTRLRRVASANSEASLQSWLRMPDVLSW